MKKEIIILIALMGIFGAVAAHEMGKPHDHMDTTMKMSGDMQMNNSSSTALVAQTNCPVMPQNTIDSTLFVDYNGERVYFCCNYCVGQFQKHPQKYLDKLTQMGQKPAATPAQ